MHVEIFVKTIAGKTFILDMDQKDTIMAVKTKIHQQEGIATGQQRLILNGQNLGDKEIVSDLIINNAATLSFYLVVNQPVQNEIFFAICPPERAKMISSSAVIHMLSFLVS